MSSPLLVIAYKVFFRSAPKNEWNEGVERNQRPLLSPLFFEPASAPSSLSLLRAKAREALEDVVYIRLGPEAQLHFIRISSSVLCFMLAEMCDLFAAKQKNPSK